MSFKDQIYSYYIEHKRSFAWRETSDPYKIVVSEIMLQQTQTDRVKSKYETFIQTFPTIEDLAQAPLAAIIAAWQGLGYNRRAQALQLLAQRVMSEYGGKIPDAPEELVKFKGIGPATAASICAFAFNKPTVFIETNIRAVFIHCHFPTRTDVADAEILPLVAETVDKENPREWYYALMDYGVMLKKLHKNPSRKSAHYTTQSKFEGSDRQVRGLILKLLTQFPRLSENFFFDEVPREPEKIKSILGDLEKEGFIKHTQGMYQLSHD